MSDYSEDELDLMSLRHMCRRTLRRGEAVKGGEEILKLLAEVLDDAVQEEALRPGGGDDVLREAFCKDEEANDD